MYFGVPAINIGRNIVGLKRNNVSKTKLNEEIARFRSLINQSELS